MSSLEKFITEKEEEMKKEMAYDINFSTHETIEKKYLSLLISALHQYDTLKMNEIEGMKYAPYPGENAWGDRTKKGIHNQTVDKIIIKVFKGE